MQKFCIHILLFCLFILLSSNGFAEGTANQSVYKITSYNLGVFFDEQGNILSTPASRTTPLMITGAAADFLNSGREHTVSGLNQDSVSTKTKGFAVSAKFDATSHLSVQGAFGVTRNLWAPDSLNYENEASWEANLGIIYRLLKNVSYELHFGYMDTGNRFTDRSSYTNVESIIMVSNQLTMSF